MADDGYMSMFTYKDQEWSLFAPGVVTNYLIDQFLKVEDGKSMFTVAGGGWVEAGNFYLPVLEHFGLLPVKTEAPLPTSCTDKNGDQITWSFDAPKEDVDIARILREARAEGALEVAIKVGDKSMTYVHRSVDGLCNTWAEATGRPTLDGFDSIVDGCFLDVFGWSRSRFPMLAEATAWRNLQEQAAAQQKPKVRVTVTGVK